MAKRRNKKGNHTALWISGAAVVGVLGVIWYEESKKPAAASSSSGSPAATPAPAPASASGDDSASLMTPVSTGPVITLPGLANDTSDTISITGSPATSPAFDLSQIYLPGQISAANIATPLPFAPQTFTAPNAPRVISLRLPGGEWQRAVVNHTYPVGTHVRMQVPSSVSGLLDTTRAQVANNNFGAWSVTAYPPGTANPKTWPDGDTAQYRLEFALNKAAVLNHGSFGPTAWVLQ